MTRSVYAVATMDTKGQELAFVAERLRAAGVPVATVDVGTLAAPSVPADIARTTVIERHPEESVRQALSHSTDRGQAIGAMSQALESFLLEEYQSGRRGRGHRHRRQWRHGARHAGHEGPADRLAQAHGLDRRQRQYRALRGLL